jgi:uncharacterized protein (TIRG00374 family)
VFEQKKSKGNPKKTLFTIIKLGIGLTLLILLLFSGDTESKLIEVFTSFRLEYIIALVLLQIVMNIVSSLKWGLFIKERGISVPLIRLFNLYLIGKFFNNFMPSMVGGDITRTFLLGRQIDSHSKSAASVFLERFTGLIAMILLAIVFTLFNLQILSEPVISISIGIIIIGCVVFFILLFNPSFIDKIEQRTKSIRLIQKVVRIIKKLFNDILFFRNRYELLLFAMLYSFLFHFLTFVNVYICCLAIGLSPSFLDIAVVTPIILLVVTIPVSPNNIGWWEWTFSVLLVHVGATIAEGLAVALILRANTVLFSLAGGIMFLFEKSVQKETLKIKEN